MIITNFILFSLYIRFQITAVYSYRLRIMLSEIYWPPILITMLGIIVIGLISLIPAYLPKRKIEIVNGITTVHRTSRFYLFMYFTFFAFFHIISATNVWAMQYSITILSSRRRRDVAPIDGISLGKAVSQTVRI
jgi:hypothetical protein